MSLHNSLILAQYSWSIYLLHKITEYWRAIFDKDMPPPPWRSYIRLAFLFHSVDFTMICLSITLSENDDIVIRTPCFPPRPHRRIAVCYHAVHSIASCQERICIDFAFFFKSHYFKIVWEKRVMLAIKASEETKLHSTFDSKFIRCKSLENETRFVTWL